jgi:hypothetical protein
MPKWNLNEVLTFLNIFKNYPVFWKVKEKQYLNKNLKSTNLFCLLTFSSFKILLQEKQHGIKRQY